MARITPLIVYLSELQEENNYQKFRDILSIEINLTHPNKLVHQAVHLYSIAIKYLLNNFKSKSNARASKAFDIVRALSLGDEFASD